MPMLTKSASHLKRSTAAKLTGQRWSGHEHLLSEALCTCFYHIQCDGQI